jgi:hypothetical protein
MPSGGMKYLREEHPDFLRIFHNYETDHGFEQWKKQIERLLNGHGTK